MLTNRDILKIIDTAEDYKNKITKVTNALEYSNLAPNNNYTELLMSTLISLQEEYKEWLGLEISTQEGEWLEYKEEEE